MGARVKRSHGFATVVEVHPDDRCSVRLDNQADRIKTEVIELRPDTVSRTSSPAYKSGQKLLLLHEKQLLEAVVDEWLGVRSGSAHRVRLGKGSLLGKGKQAAAAAERVVIEVDLNEENHAKLMLSSAAKYDDTCRIYLEKLFSRHATVKDEPTGKELQVCEQRLFLSRYVPPDTALGTGAPASTGAVAGAVAGAAVGAATGAATGAAAGAAPATAPSRQLYLLQRKKGKHGGGLGKTTGWIHRESLKKEGVNMIGGVSYEKVDDEGLHLKGEIRMAVDGH